MQALSWPGALAYRGFRRLALALVLSSFGDWLAFLATTALAAELVNGFGAKSFAVGGVLAFRLLPSVVLAPFVGVLADRLDRRMTMVVSDLLRFGLFLSIPLVDSLTWLLIATALVEVLSLVWIPAKEASVPHLAKDRLESANQISLFATYGTAPLAALLFGVLGVLSIKTGQSAAHLALFVNAGTFAFAAVQVFRIREIPTRAQVTKPGDTPPTVVESIREGLEFAHTSTLVRGLLVGMLGALAATGAVVGNGKLFTETILDGGEAAFALLFGSVFVGIALGVALGPRALRGMSRRRAFGPAIAGAGISLCFMSVVPVLALVVFSVLMLGFFAGIAYVLGLTLLGGEVEDAVRGRAFGLVNSLMRISLLLSVAAAPAIAGAIGVPRYGELDVNGVSVTLFVGGLLAVIVGLMAYRTLNDLPGVPLRHDLVRLVSRRVQPQASYAGLFIVFEGGEGAGKSTQVQRLAAVLTADGYDVVVTREPGATDAGTRIRAVLLDPATTLSARSEALLYAADRAHHVAEVVQPALARGAVVISDRYVDSSLAYQGAGRELDHDEIAELSRWATDGLQPTLTVLLDIDPAVGLARATGAPDRIEQESLAFHQAVRQGFLDLAGAEPHRYLVLSASHTADAVHEAVVARVTPLLPEHILATV
jgi:dTMP kinase